MQKSALGPLEAHRTARANTIQAWQKRWEEETRDRWTARLIPLVDHWLLRKEGEVDFYLTQFLTWHGLFRTYLFKIGKVAQPHCGHCDWPLNDAQHTFFHCKKWSPIRETLESDLGVIFTTDKIVGLMLRDRKCWARVAVFVEKVLCSRSRLRKDAVRLLTGLKRKGKEGKFFFPCLFHRRRRRKRRNPVDGSWLASP